MAVSKLEKGNDGRFSCPECSQALEYLSGGQVRVVDGKVDYDNVEKQLSNIQVNKTINNIELTSEQAQKVSEL